MYLARTVSNVSNVILQIKKKIVVRGNWLQDATSKESWSHVRGKLVKWLHFE